MPNIRYGSADDISVDPDGPTFVLLEIARDNIEAGRVSSALVYALTDSREHLLAYHESISFSISGYDHDPRELPEIPEVRRFMSQLAQEWPHWIWFLLRGAGSIPLLMSLLCDVDVIRNPDNPEQYGTEFRSQVTPGTQESPTGNHRAQRNFA